MERYRKSCQIPTGWPSALLSFSCVIGQPMEPKLYDTMLFNCNGYVLLTMCIWRWTFHSFVNETDRRRQKRHPWSTAQQGALSNISLLKYLNHGWSNHCQPIRESHDRLLLQANMSNTNLKDEYSVHGIHNLVLERRTVRNPSLAPRESWTQFERKCFEFITILFWLKHSILCACQLQIKGQSKSNISTLMRDCIMNWLRSKLTRTFSYSHSHKHTASRSINGQEQPPYVWKSKDICMAQQNSIDNLSPQADPRFTTTPSAPT